MNPRMPTSPADPSKSPLADITYTGIVTNFGSFRIAEGNCTPFMNGIMLSRKMTQGNLAVVEGGERIDPVAGGDDLESFGDEQLLQGLQDVGIVVRS